MRLRRLIQHLKDQNWFAVILDFIIVVIGVGAALMAQQWLSERQSRADYERALQSVRVDLFRVYFVSEERLAVAECRKSRYAELGKLLLMTDQAWPGSPRDYPDSQLQTVFPVVLRSPHRYWASRIWDAELNKGTFNLMGNDARVLVSSIFSTGSEAEAIQAKIRDLEAGLQVLAQPLELVMPDRLRYFETLARADSANSLLEVLALQNLQRIDASGLQLVGSIEEAETYREFLAAQNARLLEVYGECVVPMQFAFLQDFAELGSVNP
ncbi:MAG: hypothetical protein ACXIUM_11445 [Wenzhouxiangella sp.]